MGTGIMKQKAIKSDYYSKVKQCQLKVFKELNEQILYITIIDSEKDYNNWKEILFKLLEQSKYPWARALESYVSDSPFIIENKWRDHIFFSFFSQGFMYPSSKDKESIKAIGPGIHIEDFEKLLQRQLWNHYNPFNQLMRKFCSIIIKENAEIMEKIPSVCNPITNQEMEAIARGSFNPPNKYEKDLKAVNESICAFAYILVRTVKAYYKLSIDQKKTMRELQDTLYFTCLQDILSDKMYDILRRLYQAQYSRQEAILKQKVLELQKIDTKDIIKNEYHGFYQKQKIFQMLDEKATKGNVQLSSIYPATYISYINRSISFPYTTLISKLKSFEIARSIKEKFSILKSFKADIEECVVGFWKYLDVPQEKLAITADSLLDIFQYSIIKAQCQSLFSDVAMMSDYFCKIAKGEVAYILTTFQCALSCIMEIAYENHPLKQIMRKQVSQESVLLPDDD
jgi:hypothetical protein